MDGSKTTPDPLLDLERDLPTTAADVAALRRLRRVTGPGLPRDPRRLLPPFVPNGALRSRPTFAGAEPFELGPE